jgi:hypothetical protein
MYLFASSTPTLLSAIQLASRYHRNHCFGIVEQSFNNGLYFYIVALVMSYYANEFQLHHVTLSNITRLNNILFTVDQVAIASSKNAEISLILWNQIYYKEAHY